jgi:hypothetical protein
LKAIGWRTGGRRSANGKALPNKKRRKPEAAAASNPRGPVIVQAP